MNEINTARRLREAATEKAEANKILKVNACYIHEGAVAALYCT